MNPGTMLPFDCIEDPSLDDVLRIWASADPEGKRAAAVFRQTFDQLYDGQHTGRYSIDQLSKTEKTHFGSLIEINLRREFSDIVKDGKTLDFSISGHEIDCKYSQRMGGWMLPPECIGHLLLVCNADDSAAEWAIGVVRATPDNLRNSTNRDAKTSLNSLGKGRINWLHWGAELPPNVLLSIDETTRERILSQSSGQKKLSELFRLVTNRRIGRNTIATVAQQDDYMRRVRYNGGARGELQAEGFLIPGGDYAAHREVAEQLGAVVPHGGEFVSIKVAPAPAGAPHTVSLDGCLWEMIDPRQEAPCPAPILPDTRKPR